MQRPGWSYVQAGALEIGHSLFVLLWDTLHRGKLDEFGFISQKLGFRVLCTCKDKQCAKYGYKVSHC
jgi:hypothetical protein